MTKDDKKKRVMGIDVARWGMSWVDMETDPKIGKTEITGWGGYSDDEIQEFAKLWGACIHIMETFEPELIEPDPAYARKKRVPKEWQEEWK
jgi:hypothetical protein